MELFEQYCLHGATRELLAFRDSSEALRAMDYLQNTMHTSAQFIALSILQHAFMTRPREIPEAIRVLFEIIARPQQKLRLPPSSVVTSKLTQVVASFIKRSYAESNKEQLIATLQSLHPLTCMQCMSAIVGEFNCRGKLGIYGVSLLFHQEAHQWFELSRFLEQFFEICMTSLLPSSLQSLSDAIATSSSSSTVLAKNSDLVLNAFQLLQELLLWEFGTIDLDKVSESTKAIEGSLRLPQHWAPHLLNPNLLSSLFWAYLTTQQLSSSPSEDANWERCFSTIGSTILEFCSFSGKLFSNINEKCAFVDVLLTHLLPLFEQTMMKAIQSGEEAAIEQLQFLCNAIDRLQCNFKIQVLMNLSQTTPLLHTMHQATLSIAKNIYLSSNTKLQNMIKNSNARKESGEDDVFDDWRWQLLEHLLDFWAALLSDPCMVTYRFEHPHSINKSAGTNSTTFSPGARQYLLNAASLFQDVMSAVMVTLLVDSLVSADDEALDETEEVAQQKIDGILTSVCVLGRADALGSLQTIAQVVASSLENLALKSHGSSVSFLEAEYYLENLRVSILILTRLISDAEEDQVKDSGSLDLSVNSDAAMIPSAILDACLSPAPQDTATLPAVLLSGYNLILRVLDTQVRLPPSSQLYSPVILASCLKYCRLYILAYVEPSTSLYLNHTVNSLPSLFCAAGRY